MPYRYQLGDKQFESSKKKLLCSKCISHNFPYSYEISYNKFRFLLRVLLRDFFMWVMIRASKHNNAIKIRHKLDSLICRSKIEYKNLFSQFFISRRITGITNCSTFHGDYLTLFDQYLSNRVHIINMFVFRNYVMALNLKRKNCVSIPKTRIF